MEMDTEASDMEIFGMSARLTFHEAKSAETLYRSSFYPNPPLL